MEEKKLARRYNKNKIRYELIPSNALKELAKVYTKGAAKYTISDEQGNIIEDGSNNWRLGLPWMDVLASVQRHIEAFKAGEDIDEELGTYHLANASWGLFTLLEQYKTHPQLDNRIQSYLAKPKIGLDLDGVLVDLHPYFCKVAKIKPYDPTHWNCPIYAKEFKKVIDDKEFWLDAPALALAKDIPFEPHCYITSRQIPVEITKRWLFNNGYPDAPVYSVGHNKSKLEVAKESGIDWFVDDKFENFRELNEAGICTFLFDASHNRHRNVGYKRIYSLKDLVS